VYLQKMRKVQGSEHVVFRWWQKRVRSGKVLVFSKCQSIVFFSQRVRAQKLHLFLLSNNPTVY